VKDNIVYLTEAAKEVGVAAITLKRWLLDGKVRDVKRDRKGWRIFTAEDIQFIKEYADRISPPPHEQIKFPLEGFQSDNNKTASFRDSAFNGNKKLPFHRWVPWIAGFSANFVEDCFEKYLDTSIPSSSQTVLDPFAGVGTTLTEGVMHGYNVIGFEINPYAYLACKVKLNAHNLSTDELKESLQKFAKYYEKRASDEGYQPRTPFPEGFNTRAPFYSPDVQRKALIFFDYLPNIKNLDIRNVFKLAFGTVMVSFSNYSYEPSLGRRFSSGKPDITDANVGEIIYNKINEMAADIDEFDELHAETAKRVKSDVYNETFFNAMDFCEPQNADLLVTSPPYLNNYHYMRNTRPQLHWLDLARGKDQRKNIENHSFGKFWQTVRDKEQINPIFDLERLENKLATLREINPEKRTYGGAGWANYAATYFNDSFRFCKIVKQIIKPTGTAVVVIGNSIIQGIEIETDKIFADIAELTGLKTKDIILLRTKRTGSSIVDSTVRAAKVKKKTVLYETAVILSK